MDAKSIMEASLVIDNKPRSSKSGATFERKSPVTGAVVTKASAGEVADAIAAAEFGRKGVRDLVDDRADGRRRRILLKAADILEAELPEFLPVIAAEIGASELWAGFNVVLSVGLLREAAGLATQILSVVRDFETGGGLI